LTNSVTFGVVVFLLLLCRSISCDLLAFRRISVAMPKNQKAAQENI
jgi:hypothetical protein